MSHARAEDRQHEAVKGVRGGGNIIASQRALPSRLLGLIRTLARSSLRGPWAVRRWVALPPGDRRSTLHALVALLCVEATIRWVRIPTIARALGVQLAASGPQATTARQLEDEATASSGSVDPPRTSQPARPGIRWDTLGPEEVTALRATLRVIRRWPFGTGPCLRESLVLGHLLRSRCPTLCFGVARHGRRVLAHAWIEIDGRAVNDPLGVVRLERPSSRS